MHYETRTFGGSVRGSLVGQLLVAAPALEDPDFDRTVVMLLLHDVGGALGVVLNRATDLPVSELFDGWGGMAGEPGVVFEGGPVQPEAALCLAQLRDGGSLKSFISVAGRLGTVDLAADPEGVQAAVNEVRVFAGYAGWAPGQLEAEVAEGAWLVCDALPGDPFVPRPEELWPMVLHRQGGLLSALAHFPVDPSLN